MYCCPYYDNGQFNIIIFDQKGDQNILNINSLLKISKLAKAINNIQNPQFCACVHERKYIYISLLHKRNASIYACRYNIQ